VSGPFAELHCHSAFSFLDGASEAPDLVARALELGLSALAVTDHQGLYGAVRFQAAAHEAGLPSVIGVEVELADPAVPDPAGIVLPARRAPAARRGRRSGGEEPRRPVAGEPVRPPVERLRPPGHRAVRREDLRGVRSAELGPHLVLLARDMSGYRSLCRLLSAGNLAGSKGVPRIDHALLAREQEGIIVLTGCRHGELSRRLLAGDGEGARAAARRLREIAGDALHVELQHHLLPDDDLLVAELVRLAEELSLPVVVSNDPHYARPEDRELQDVLVAIRHGRTLETSARLRRPNGEYHLKGAAELAALPPGLPDAEPAVRAAWLAGIARSAEVAAGCAVELAFERYRFPGFAVPDGATPATELARLCREGARRRYHPLTPEIDARLDHELGVIERSGLAEFFLICHDLMRFCRERGIPAQGRGSAGDSIVAYVLGITRVDPIRHALLFERFINEGRTSYPDVDIDIASDRRDEVIAYVHARYGPEHTGMVCNVVTYRARSAVREIGTALGFPRPLVDRVAKAIETYDPVMVRRDLEADGGFAELFHPSGEAGPPGGAAGSAHLLDARGELRRPVPPPAAGDDRGGPGDTPASARFLAAARERAAGRGMDPPALPAAPLPDPTGGHGSTVGLTPWERWLTLCARIDGLPRHLSIHVGGMLVTGAPLVEIAPLERATMPGRVVVQYDKRDVETIRLVKLDLLGLRMLSAIEDALRAIATDCAVHVDLDRLPEEIPEVFRMIRAADTVGVFQVESRAQMQTLPRSRPETLDDLVVEVAIIRPGPIQGNAVHPYLRRRQGIEPVEVLHPSLAPILAETLGVILYQEQVMRIAIDVAGFTPGDSDAFRRAMGTSRSTREMEKLHARFVSGCIATAGLAPEVAEELFGRVAGFASFGFNKSHAAAFARTAYESAFLKLFYPAHFLQGLLNNQPMGFYPIEVLLNDARRHGVAVLPVEIDRSRFRSVTEWVGPPGTPLPPGTGIEGRPLPVHSPGVILPDASARERWAAPGATEWGVRLGLGLVRGIGEVEGEAIEREVEDGGPFRSLTDLVERTRLPERVIERLIRAGALDRFGVPRRELLWQLGEVIAASRPAGLRLPPTPAPDLPPPTELERLGDSYAILSFDARRQVLDLFRPALDRLGALRIATLDETAPGPVRIGGLVVTRQHPMTAKGTVFLALEDETGMANVTLWPRTWEAQRGVVRRHALLWVEGTLQREDRVVNVIARRIRPLGEVCRAVDGPEPPPGVRRQGYEGMRRAG